MICPSCNTTNRDDARFCKNCGRSLSSVLTPENKVTYPAQRWGDEAQQAEQSASNAPGDAGWEDEPTLLASPAAQNQTAPPSIADLPTLMTPASHEDEAAHVAPPPPLESISAAESSNHQGNNLAANTEGEPPAASAPGEYNYAQDNGGYPAVQANEEKQQPAQQSDEGQPGVPAQQPEEAAPVETDEAAEQTEQEEPEQAPETAEAPQQTQEFAPLAVGTIVQGRYEVVQVISDEPHEHVYHVIDHQGYQRCWSCGFEQNAEGDEFCGECGASLLDAPYIMHEYSTQQSSEDVSVLQGAIVNTFVDQGRTYAIEQVQAEQSAFPNGVCLQAATASDAGNVRRSDPNEDSTLVIHFQRIHESVSTPLGVFIVADGMGGHDNGQGASRMAINIIAERLTRDLLLAPLTAEKNGQQPPSLAEDDLLLLLHSAVEDANNALCQKNAQEKTDMGSTLTGCMIVGEHAYIVNVGDSRTYMLRNKQLYQVTTDHSLVAQLVASGLIEPDDVYTHPQRSQIFRSLGDKPGMQIDIFKQQLVPGDILLSCCDGVWEMVRNPQIEQILNNASDPQTACAQLIEAANAGGGEDNISAVVVFVR